MDNVAVFFGLLMLFIFIFSILGMNLFGCKFCDPETGNCERKNFDSLLWATVTVFQVLFKLKRKNNKNMGFLWYRYVKDIINQIKIQFTKRIIIQHLDSDPRRLEHCTVLWNGEN